jgi:hypothetical protein
MQGDSRSEMRERCVCERDVGERRENASSSVRRTRTLDPPPVAPLAVLELVHAALKVAKLHACGVNLTSIHLTGSRPVRSGHTKTCPNTFAKSTTRDGFQDPSFFLTRFRRAARKNCLSRSLALCNQV